MKLVKIILVVVAACLASARRRGCDVPLSQADPGFEFNASSHAMDREPELARLGTKKAWCAKSTIKFTEYLEVKLSTLRHISAIELQGAKWSLREFYVKSYLIRYSIDGKKWKFYKSRSKTTGRSKLLPWTQTFTGNTNAVDKSLNDIHPSFVARYIQIFPLEFRNAMCMKVEVYGCNETVDCTHVVKLTRGQRASLTTPSYPKPYRDEAHCNWLVYLPEDTPVSLISMDFDFGGSSLDQQTCGNNTVKVYRNLHPFSKYLMGTFCNTKTMPRELKVTTDSLRISFTGGFNHMSRHRGFSFLVWASNDPYKTARACENSTITLDCRNAELDIEVIAANYGRRQNYPVCAENGTTAMNMANYTDSCKSRDVLPKLKTICDYRNVCKIVLDHKTFPHRCSTGDALEMFVVYQCNATKPTTTPPPTTTPTTLSPTTTPVVTEAATKSTERSTQTPHGATTESLAQPRTTPSIILIAAVPGGVAFILMLIIAIITCFCCRKNRKKEKAELANGGIVPSESTQSKVLIESESLYEKIDELEMNPVRYEAEPNKYSPLHDARRGMSENPLYQSGGPAQPQYDAPNTPRYQNYVHRPQSVGNPLLPPNAAEANYIDVLKSPEELPSNSLPIVKYLEPSKSSPDFCVKIPLDRYSDSVDTPTESSAPGDDVYEAMDGSNA